MLEWAPPEGHRNHDERKGVEWKRYALLGDRTCGRAGNALIRSSAEGGSTTATTKSRLVVSAQRE